MPKPYELFDDLEKGESVIECQIDDGDSLTVLRGVFNGFRKTQGGYSLIVKQGKRNRFAPTRLLRKIKVRV